MRLPLSTVFTVIALAAPASRAAGPFTLNDTGQARCLDAGGELGGDCAGSGQDGEFGRDASKPFDGDGHAGFRFVRVCGNGDEAGQGGCPAEPVLGIEPQQWACTRDRVTGLTWEIKTTDGSVRDMARQFTVVDVHEPSPLALLDALNGAAICGMTSWRLPGTLELHSIVDHSRPRGEGGLAIDQRYFPNTQPNDYHNAWPADSWRTAIDFGRGFAHARIGIEPHYLRAVSSPKRPLPAPRYRPLGDGSQVEDGYTGLIWARCPVGTTWSTGACVGTPALFTWREALAWAAGQPGWRVPNAKEAMSRVGAQILDRPANPYYEAFPIRSEGAQWTSTPAPREAGRAFQFVNGHDVLSQSLLTEAVHRPGTLLLVRDTR
ncbi:DUF1566 domain-containing protein [Ideonella sp.]|uniref:DUF1566 domain-containing protein n=1 Tax=Ideonella sp. TaxID=1929293 RepID=UPI0035AFA5C8